VSMSKKQVRNQATKVSSKLQSNYSELSLIILLDHERQEEIECLFEKILGIPSLYNSTQLQLAVIAKSAQRVLAWASQDNMAQFQGRRREREYEQQTG